MAKRQYTKAQGRATQEYLKDNREQLRVWVHKGEVASLREEAAAHDMSMAAFVVEAINHHVGREILTPADSTRGRKADAGSVEE